MIKDPATLEMFRNIICEILMSENWHALCVRKVLLNDELGIAESNGVIGIFL